MNIRFRSLLFCSNVLACAKRKSTQFFRVLGVTKSLFVGFLGSGMGFVRGFYP